MRKKCSNFIAAKHSVMSPSKIKSLGKSGRKAAGTAAAFSSTTTTQQIISARVSYVQKDRDVDILILWLDRPVKHWVPLRAFHPQPGQQIMLVSAAITQPHDDIVVSTGVVSKSPTNPDSQTALCRAQRLVSARGYSGSLVLEYLGASNLKDPDYLQQQQQQQSQLQQQLQPTSVTAPLPKQRVLGMHVSVYRDKNTKQNIEVEFVSSYRILKTMALYNVDVYSLYAQGRAPKHHYQTTTRATTSSSSSSNQRPKQQNKKESGKRRQRGE